MKLKLLLTLLKKKWRITLVVILLLLGIILYLKTRTNNKIELKTQLPVKQTISKTLEVSGHVDAKEKVRLRFIAGGKLTYIGAKEGDKVKKWQTIATIDKATLKKQLEQDLNNYSKERWDWEETLDNNKDKPLTTTEKRTQDKQQWDLNNTVLTVEIRDIALKNTSLYAPFDGILTTAPTSVAGMQVLATDYFEIVNPNTLVFRAAVDESDIANIKIGQNAKLTLDAYQEQEIDTQVSYISYTSTETSSGTSFVVEFALNNLNPNLALRIGMNGDIKILLKEKQNVLTIPSIALIQREDINYVLVLNKDGQTEEKEVEVGLETDDLVEITSGLSEQDQVVIPE